MISAVHYFNIFYVNFTYNSVQLYIIMIKSEEHISNIQ